MLIILYRAFKAVLFALLHPDFRNPILKLPSTNTIPERIRNDPKLFPFFKDCLGAADCSHVPVHPPSLIQGPWRDRDGNLTMNMLAVCNFAMLFMYILVGWEGSASDSFLWDHAAAHEGLNIPQGKYYLADAGFASCDALLVPYRNVHYHLREWKAGSQRCAVFCISIAFS